MNIPKLGIHFLIEPHYINNQVCLFYIFRFNGLLGSEIDNSTSTVEMIAFLQTWNIWVNQISNKLDSVSGMYFRYHHHHHHQ